MSEEEDEGSGCSMILKILALWALFWIGIPYMMRANGWSLMPKEEAGTGSGSNPDVNEGRPLYYRE